MASVEAIKDVALVTRDPQTQMLDMMERLASNKDVDVVKLQALIDMQKDILAVNARAAFNAAKASLLAELPTIIEKAKGDKDITYAPLEDIIEAVRPILSKHGFALSHRTEWPDPKTVKVVGVLTHRDGHCEESEFQAAADQTGSKNAIQALGSSVSYGRRYTTNDLLCIVTRKQDDNGAKSEIATAPEGYGDWVDDMDALVIGGCTLPELERAWKESKDDFRRYMAKTEKHRVEGWKKRAKAVSHA